MNERKDERKDVYFQVNNTMKNTINMQYHKQTIAHGNGGKSHTYQSIPLTLSQLV